MLNPGTVDHRRFLAKGSHVEVCSDEEGFRGAWFEATVVDVPPKSASKKRKRALVQYNNLLADDGCTLLTELVDPDSIRPPPPHDGVSDRGFEVTDVVDANFKDGWWTGVVTKLLDDSRARIYFDSPPDIIDFDMKDLRLHWKWVDGKWVQAEKNKQLAGSVFSSGTAVEVNLDKDNLRDVWFPAIIIKEIEKNSFLVKCNTSRNCNSSANCAMEKFEVHMQHIRPPPPPHNVDIDYELLEKVDAFWNCGWRAGIVTKLLSGRRYSIFFKQGNETKELSCTDLRPHDEWIDGNWITKSKEILNGSGNLQEQLDELSDVTHDQELVENSDVAEGKSVKKMQPTNATNDLMEQSTDTHDTPPFPSIKVMELTNPDTGHSPSSKKLCKSDYKQELEQALNKEFLCTQTMGTKESEASPTNIKSIQMSARTEKPSPRVIAQTASNVCQHHPSNWKTKRCKVGHTGSQIIDVVKTSARATKSTSKSSLDFGTGRVGNGNKAENFNGNKLSAKGVETPIILGLKAKMSRISKNETSPEALCKESLKLIREKVSTEDGSPGSKSMETPQGHGVQVPRRKRGRPCKFVATSSKESNAGSKQSGEKLTVKEMVDMVRRGAEKLEEMADMVHGAEEPAVQTYHRNNLTDSQDATAGRTDVIEGNCNMKRAIVDMSSNTNDEDQPLSTLFGVMSPPMIEGSKLGSRVIANGVTDAQRQVDAEAEDRAVVLRIGGTAVDGSQILPFEKRSSVWKMIESLDVFQEVPQNPHFLPLVGMKEEFREGAAIGIMVSYSSLFEKVSSLQLDDPKGMLESTWDFLNDLEMHGFDVGFLRARLNKLSSIRGSQEQLLEKSKNAERKLVESTNEKAKCCQEVDEINMKIAELQEQLLAVKSKDENIDSDIASFRRCIDGVQERLANIRNEFKSVATAPWKVP